MARVGMGKEGRMSGMVREAPAGAKGMGSDVGAEKKADMKGGLMGSPQDQLSGAVKELKKQHPIKHDDLGPHHNAPMPKVGTYKCSS